MIRKDDIFGYFVVSLPGKARQLSKEGRIKQR